MWAPAHFTKRGLPAHAVSSRVGPVFRSNVRVVLNCGHLNGRTLTGHYSQVLTGLQMLARQKRIDLHFGQRTLGVDVEAGGRRIAYDVLDGPDLDPDWVRSVDRLHKRSFHPDWVAACPRPERIRPLGLNLEIHADGLNRTAAWYALQCGARGMRRALTPISELGITNSWRVTPERLQALNRPGQLQIIFITRLWEPDHPALAGTPDVNVLNASRIACIRALRKAFGKRAIAGCVATPLAKVMCPELIDHAPSDRRSYLERVAACAIGVSTLGLFGSNPWKLAEYVALGRAIVTEPLQYVVPGLDAGTHYLQFNTADECCEQTQRLFDDPMLRQQLAASASAYHAQHMRPDLLVWNTLQPELC